MSSTTKTPPTAQEIIGTLMNSLTETTELVQDNSIEEVFHKIEFAEVDYRNLSITLEQLEEICLKQKAIVQAHDRVAQMARMIAEEKKKANEAKAIKAFQELEKEFKALKGNADFPKLFITQITGPTATAIKALINKKLNKDRYVTGKSINAFAANSSCYTDSRFNGSTVDRADFNKLLVLRLDATEALIAKTTCSEKAIVVDDPDASKWSDLMIAAHASHTTVDFTFYDKHFQEAYKLLKAFFEK